MGFFDKIDDSVIVDTFEQFLSRTNREIFFADIPQIGTFRKNMIYCRWKSTKPHVGR